MKHNKIIIIILVLYFGNLFSQKCNKYYYGVNGYTKLELNYKTNKYYLYYFINRIDSGNFEIVKDTLILTSYYTPYSIVNDDINKIYKTFKHKVEGYYVLYETKEEQSLIRCDTTSLYTDDNKFYFIISQKEWKIMPNSIVTIFSPALGNTVGVFQFFPDTTKDIIVYNLDISNSLLRPVYFNRFKLIIKGKQLLPIDIHSLMDFYLFNQDMFLPMKQGDKSKKYKLYDDSELYKRATIKYNLYSLWFR